MRKKVFEFRIESNVGTTNPIVARLGPQSADMLHWLDVTKEQGEQLQELYLMTLRRRLVGCLEIRDEIVQLVNAQAEMLANGTLGEDMQPNVVGLNRKAENFLYEVKNYLRDLLKLLQVVYACPLKDASDLVDLKGKGHSNLVEWANKKLGPASLLAQIVAMHETWMGILIRRRNAVEHPGGYSGTMKFQNVRRDPSNSNNVEPPTWNRDAEPPADMDAAMSNMLRLAEDILCCAIRDKPTFPHIRFVEIPADKRDPACPIRLRVTLSAELEAKLPE